MDTTEVVTSAASNTEKVEKLSRIAASKTINAKVASDDYAVVTADLLKDYIAVYGSLKANKMLPDLLNEFVSKAFSTRAKAIKRSIAVRRVRVVWVFNNLYCISPYV